MKPVRILIADDHEVVRQGVRAVLEGQTGWVVCGEASTGREAMN
jgi:DNA-binding NarL/FixJ family response regulator